MTGRSGRQGSRVSSSRHTASTASKPLAETVTPPPTLDSALLPQVIQQGGPLTLPRLCQPTGLHGGWLMVPLIRF